MNKNYLSILFILFAYPASAFLSLVQKSQCFIQNYFLKNKNLMSSICNVGAWVKIHKKKVFVSIPFLFAYACIVKKIRDENRPCHSFLYEDYLRALEGTLKTFYPAYYEEHLSQKAFKAELNTLKLHASPLHTYIEKKYEESGKDKDWWNKMNLTDFKAKVEEPFEEKLGLNFLEYLSALAKKYDALQAPFLEYRDVVFSLRVFKYVYENTVEFFFKKILVSDAREEDEQDE